MMLICESSLESAISQVALDEWQWQEAEHGRLHDDLLRIWETSDYAIVLGRGSKSADEIDRVQAERDQVPVVRRITGGAAIVCGPGCLMYSLVLHKCRFPAARHIDTTHQFVLSRVADAICQQDCHVQRAGTSDLVLPRDHQLLKCSGNSMRLGRQTALYHGTLLYDMNLSVIPRWLRHPGREPSYRNGRIHEAFLTNLPLSRQSLCRALLSAFPAQGTCQGPGQRELAPLVAARYTDDAWNYCL